MNILLTESQFDTLFLGKKVMVYFNLHKKTFSVTHKSKVIMHADYVKLSDVEFRVRQGGRDKVRGEKQKNVHAFVIGTLLNYCESPCGDIPNPPSDIVVTYNPYNNDSFVYKDNEEPIYQAHEVDMVNLTDKIFVVKKNNSDNLNESIDENDELLFEIIDDIVNYIFGGFEITNKDGYIRVFTKSNQDIIAEKNRWGRMFLTLDLVDELTKYLAISDRSKSEKLIIDYFESRYKIIIKDFVTKW